MSATATLARLASLALGTGVVIALNAPPAHASDMCSEVWLTGTFVEYQGTCEPYSGGITCVSEDAGLDPKEHVWTRVCVPSL